MLIKHHTKYKEIHGIDETVLMEMSDHIKLHRRLRKEGKCKVPVEIMHDIAATAHKRTDKCRETNKKYREKSRKCINFYEPLMEYVALHESIRYNTITGHIECNTRIYATGGKELLYIGERCMDDDEIRFQSICKEILDLDSQLKQDDMMSISIKDLFRFYRRTLK